MREIHCQCGTTFSTVEDAPTWVRCPHCGREVHLPAGSENDQGPISSVLPYGAPENPSWHAKAFMLGFFGTLGFTVIAFVGLFFLGASTFEAPPGSKNEAANIFCVVLVVGGYVAIGWIARKLSKQHQWAGIGRGVIVGICLSMIVMIPCAGAIIG